MLFQFEMAALLEDNDTGERHGGSKRERRGEMERESRRIVMEKKGEDGGMEHLLVIQFHIPYGFITIMRERRLQSD